ncbi:MAG: molecular chaperone DnaJ [Candidatus Staskawiczbacteria bacterium CG10_big_fil_rev_8_21_14_0_10_38_10]|uniref:Chaperone protein DnaJ n=1 Tax=Candidatus Staskawiczbacteria bacterium CG10_big_fil_rev_8_21_14_0_10_38_10 TaxID=1974891 RepID=A0A2H9T1B0_9BACT|nr:MAG: molecular chaperone DnaJ [Candidatus Staskawiczbacteria bacterium CG10_big_fil_rev_8_21_14_0_10_38_10]
MAKDYYKILGVSRDAPPEEIKRAYYNLAQKYHPDKGGGNETKFKEINEAYQILSNKDKKSQYDRFGQVFEGAPGFDFSQQKGWDFGSMWQDFSKERGFNFDVEDLGDLFEEFFGFNSKAPKREKNKGDDLELELDLNLEEILTGRTKEISVNKQVACNRCDGTGAEPGTKVNECFSCRGMGYVQQIKRSVLGSFTRVVVCPECGGEGKRPEKNCNVCRGEGRIKKEEVIKIFIPAGVDSNQVIKIKGKGDAGKRGAAAGDLYLRIFIKPHRVLKRKGDDLYLKVPISFSRAVLGGEIEIPTLEQNKILLKIPAGTDSGKVFRISKKGIPHFSGSGRGNLYIEIEVKTPKNLTKKQRELLEKLQGEGL